MNILYIHCTSDLYGASRCLLYAVERQVEEGHLVCVIIPFDGILKQALEQRGAKVVIHSYDPTLRKIHLSSFGKLCRFVGDIFRSFFAYRKTARAFSADLIHTNTSVTVTGGLVAKALRIPHICHMRESYSEFKWLWRFYEPFLVLFSERIICVSQSIKNEFSERNQSTTKVVVIYDGILDEDLVPPAEQDVLAFKERLGLDGCTVVGLVGRIILNRKGQDVLVRAAALLKNKYPNVRFVIVGGCYPGNEYHQRNLEQLIQDLGVRDLIIFAGEMADPKSAYGAFDISVMASGMPEPFGMVTVESMAQGLPVVGTNFGGTREIVESGVTGFLVPPNDPRAMADALSVLLDDPALCRSMGSAGRARVQWMFLFSKYYEALMIEYSLILEE